MIEAYVEGRPISRSSSSLISVASVNRDGGLVSWPSADSEAAVTRSPSASAGRRVSWSSRAAESSVPST